MQLGNQHVIEKPCEGIQTPQHPAAVSGTHSAGSFASCIHIVQAVPRGTLFPYFP